MGCTTRNRHGSRDKFYRNIKSGTHKAARRSRAYDDRLRQRAERMLEASQHAAPDALASQPVARQPER